MTGIRLPLLSDFASRGASPIVQPDRNRVCVSKVGGKFATIWLRAVSSMDFDE
jgi:hypothetical protein